MGKIHVCDVCNYTTPYITNIRNHLISRTKCGTTNDPRMVSMMNKYLPNQTGQNHCCKICDKEFTQLSSVNRHMKTCQPNPTLTKVIEELSKQVQALTLKVDQQSKITNVTNNYTQININAFGQEDLSHITPEFLEQCVRRTSKGHLELITFIYNHKSNWNVKYTEKPNRLLVWNGNKFEMMMRNDVYDAAIIKSFHLLKDFFEANIVVFKSKLSDSYVEHIDESFHMKPKDNFEHNHKVQIDVKQLFKTIMGKRENIKIPDTDDEDNDVS
jgi:hypothetical protein